MSIKQPAAARARPAAGPAALLALALTAVPAAAAAAPQPPAAAQALPTGLEAEVRALNTTLGELVGLLRRQLEGQYAGVLMQRVQLMTSRMAPLEEQLRGARSEQRGLSEDLDRMELIGEQVEAQYQAELAGGADPEQAEAGRERMRADLELRRKQIRDRLWQAEQRVIDLEQRLDRRRVEIETWEGEIDRYLGLR